MRVPSKAPSIVTVTVIALALTGCANWQDKHTEGTVIGGLAGAGLGAAIGAATGSWAWGAVIGLGAGALTGYVIADNTGSDSRPPLASSTGDSEADRRRADADSYFQQSLSASSPVESRQLLEKSIDLYPTAASHNNLGTIYVAEGNRGSAEVQFRKALDLDPSYAPARQNLDRLAAGD